MAYLEHGMWEVLDVLRRLHRGESQVAIGAATGRDRKTIRRYLRAARELSWDPAQEPDEALAGRVLERLRPGPRSAAPVPVDRLLRQHRSQIRVWLAEGPDGRGSLTLTKVRKLLARQGVPVSYSKLYRFCVEHCAFGQRRRLTVRVAESPPGEVAEVDFGRLGLVYDPQRERRRIARALIVTLVHSRHQYVHVSYSQKLHDLIDGIEDAWEFFGGCTKRVVLDNLRAAVTKADRYDPVFQRTFDEYAQYRGFIIDPALPRHGQGKPHVERGVPYVRESFFRGEDWLDIDHVQREARTWCLTEAGTRRHGTTGKRPLAVFEEEEKPTLIPIHGARFDAPHWAECIVHPDHHIQFRKATYSIPTRYVGKTVTVRGDRALVRAYYRGQMIKVHPTQPPGGRITDYNDYPEEIAPYAMRDPDRVIHQARRIGERTGRFAEQLLSGPFPWSRLRQAQKLLRLAAKYGRQRLEKACRRALAFDLINVRRLEGILRDDLSVDDQPEVPPPIIPLPSRFLRPRGSFTHHPHTEEVTDGD
ncbi:MAG: IS21 family transposase [Acidobacteria bacterium]|nr:IS21 family transposase [Acidobacteriota bacterium]